MMAKVSPYLRSIADEEVSGFSHWCPGCESMHSFWTFNKNGRPVWTFDGNLEKPTFGPSMHIRTGHYVPSQAGKPCWYCEQVALGKRESTLCSTCHYYLTDGMINFLGDSTHHLSGQKVPLPELPEDHSI